MKATIWHNPKCGTSRKTLAILENLSQVDVTVVEYLKQPPTREKLAQLFADAGMTPAREAIRRLTAEGALEAGGNRRVRVPDMTRSKLDQISFGRMSV